MNAHAKPVATNPFHNYTPEFLADEIGAQDAIAKEAQARLDALKEEAKRRGIESAQGSHWRISVTTGERKTVDLDKLRKDLGSLDGYERSSPTCTLRISSLFQQPEVEG